MPAPVTLVCDVDHTVLDDDDTTRALAAAVTPLRDRGRLRFVLNSSRFVDSIADSVRTTPLATPDFVIGGMGTQITRWDADREIPVACATGEAWAARLGAGFDADTIDRLIAEHAGDASGFRMHDAGSLSPLKRSFD